MEPLGAGRIAPARAREPSSAAIFCQPKPGGNSRERLPLTPAGWKYTAASRSCSPTLGYLKWHQIVGGFSWIFSVISDFHPFICFTAGSGDWNPSGVPTHQEKGNAPLSRRVIFVPKAFNRVRYNFSIFPYSLQEGTGLGLPFFSAVRCQLPKDRE